MKPHRGRREDLNSSRYSTILVSLFQFFILILDFPLTLLQQSRTVIFEMNNKSVLSIIIISLIILLGIEVDGERSL